MQGGINIENSIKRIQWRENTGALQYILLYSTDTVLTPPHPHEFGIVTEVLKGNYSVNGEQYGPGTRLYTKPGQEYTSKIDRDTVLTKIYVFSCNAERVPGAAVGSILPSHQVLTDSDILGNNVQMQVPITTTDLEQFEREKDGAILVKDLDTSFLDEIYGENARKFTNFAKNCADPEKFIVDVNELVKKHGHGASSLCCTLSLPCCQNVLTMVMPEFNELFSVGLYEQRDQIGKTGALKNDIKDAFINACTPISTTQDVSAFNACCHLKLWSHGGVYC